MKNAWLQPVCKFLLIHAIGLVIILFALVTGGIYSKESQADAITSGLKQNFLVGDYRSVVSVLDNALLFNFDSIDVADARGKKLFSVGKDNKRSEIFQAKYVTHIHFGDNVKPKGTIIFNYSFKQMIIYGIITDLLIILLSIPYLIYLKRRMKLKFELESKQKQLDFRLALAEQVTHDIRSPLAALNMVIEQYNNIQERDLSIIKSSTQRINDIANNLLSKNKHTSRAYEIKENLTNQLIPPIIDALISEKRMEFRQQTGVEIELDLKNSFGAFAFVNTYELSCVVSNLINNSIESFEQRLGKVLIKVITLPHTVEITIQDNGKGMSREVLEQLGSEGFSYGKEYLENKGNGLGFFNSKKIIEHNFGGKLEVKSEVGKGTIVSIQLKKANLPKWFPEEINLFNFSSVITLDDDQSIHQVWDRRFCETGESLFHRRKFQSVIDFKDFAISESKMEGCFFLIDFEFLDQKLDGLQIIEELGIEKCSILVTSRYENPSVQERAGKVGVKILPKFYSSIIPIVQDERKRIFYDVILLDDDELIRLTWEERAKKNKLLFLSLANTEELWSKIDTFSGDSVFYIDVNLSSHDNGEEVSKQLYDRGFTNLYLTTGYEKQKFEHVKWVKGIVGKDFAHVLRV